MLSTKKKKKKEIHMFKTLYPHIVCKAKLVVAAHAGSKQIDKSG